MKPIIPLLILGLALLASAEETGDMKKIMKEIEAKVEKETLENLQKRGMLAFGPSDLAMIHGKNGQGGLYSGYNNNNNNNNINSNNNNSKPPGRFGPRPPQGPTRGGPSGPSPGGVGPTAGGPNGFSHNQAFRAQGSGRGLPFDSGLFGPSPYNNNDGLFGAYSEPGYGKARPGRHLGDYLGRIMGNVGPTGFATYRTPEGYGYYQKYFH